MADTSDAHPRNPARVDSTGPFFWAEGDSFVPTRLARGPWGPSLAGNYVGGLLARSIENVVDFAGLRPARLTVDLLHPVKLHPVTVCTAVVRHGRRFAVIDAEMLQADKLVARGSAMLLAPSEHSADTVWSSPITMPAAPSEPDLVPLDVPMVFHSYGRDPVHGSAGVGVDEWRHNGPKYVWLKETNPLVDDEPLSPFIRVAMAGDVTSSLTNWGIGGLGFINTDYTISLSRLPRGSFVGLAAMTHYNDDGVATGTATLYDGDGPFGNGMATALAHPGFTAPSAHSFR